MAKKHQIEKLKRMAHPSSGATEAERATARRLMGATTELSTLDDSPIKIWGVLFINRQKGVSKAAITLESVRKFLSHAKPNTLYTYEDFVGKDNLGSQDFYIMIDWGISLGAVVKHGSKYEFKRDFMMRFRESVNSILAGFHI